MRIGIFIILVAGWVIAQNAMIAADPGTQKEFDAVVAPLCGVEPAPEALDTASCLIVGRGQYHVAFLKEQALRNDRAARRVALRAMIRNDDRPAILGALFSLGTSENYWVREDAVTAISRLPRKELLAVADNLVRQSSSPAAKISAFSLLTVFGEEPDLSIASEIERECANPALKKDLSYAKAELEYKLSLSEAQRRAWEDQAVPYWRVLREVPDFHSIVHKYVFSAQRLYNLGNRFTLPFLRYHLDRGDPLAAAIIAVQNETSAMQDLEKHLSDKGMMYDVSRQAIAMMKKANR
jgi:hypothetical protein